MFRRSLPEPVRSIVALTKHRFMGDTIVAIPLLRAARVAFPEACITLLTGSGAAVALENCPFVDRVLTYSPHDRKFNYWTVYNALTADGERPDLCLVADRSFRSAYMALHIGGRVRAGFASEGRGFLLTHPVPYRTDAPETDCCLDIIRAVAPEGKDREPYDATPELFLTGEERQRGARLLAEREADGPVLVGFQPGASYDAKQWVPARFGAVASALAQEGAGIVLLGHGEGEEQAAREMRQALRGVSVVDLTGQTSLRETMAVLSHLSLFVGNDTGVNHLAAAVGVPTLGLFGPTSAVKWGRVGANHAVLTAPDGDLKRLEAGPVLDAARALLRRRAVAPTTRPAEPVPLGAGR
jgi:heptosyltransferase II